MPLALRTCFLRLVVVVGATVGVAFVVVAVINKPHRALSVRDHIFCGRPGGKNRVLAVGCTGMEKRNLQDTASAPSGGENHAWFPHKDRENRTNHYDHHDHHEHYEHDSHHFNDDDGFEDKYSDDDDDDENDSDREAASIQSGILTNMDGVNIGNTITIININSGNQSSSSGSADYPYYAPNGRTPSNYGISDNGRSAITSAAVRAFCTSIRCSPSFAETTTTNSANESMIPSIRGGNLSARGNNVQYRLPMKTNGSSGVKPAKWLLLVAILVQFRHI